MVTEKHYASIADSVREYCTAIKAGRKTAPDKVLVKFLDTVVASTEKTLRGQQAHDAQAFYDSWRISGVFPLNYRLQVRKYREALNGHPDQPVLDELCKVLGVLKSSAS